MQHTALRFLTALVVAGAVWLGSPSDAGAAPPVCGVAPCQGSETCAGGCTECCVCGTGTCDASENCLNCSADCGACPVGCGDFVCADSEDCSSCANDCGTCPGYPTIVDFGSCAPILGDCDATTTDCCKRPFGSFNGALPILIPMDRCHNPITTGGNKYSAPDDAAPKWCANPGLEDPDILLSDGVSLLPGTGMIEAYGLVYRLMQHGIPVYWVINPTKDPQALSESQSNLNAQTYSDRDIDFWVLSPDDADGKPPATTAALAACNGACDTPIKRLNPDFTVAESYSKQEFPVRGSAFIIAANDRARFEELFTQTGEFAAFAGSSFYDFDAVDLYEIQDGAQIMYQNFRSKIGPYVTVAGAPVFKLLDSPPPRLAMQDGGPADIWLGRARLDQQAAPGCETGQPFSPADAVYCEVSNANIDTDDVLNTGDFSWAWLHAPGLPCTAMDELDNFMTAIPDVKDGHHIMFMEKALEISESCAEGRFLGVDTSGVTPVATSGAAPYILRYPANVIAQIGDVPAGFAQGSPSKWSYKGSILYRPEHYDYPAGGTLVRLVSEDYGTLCTGPLNKSTPACDTFGDLATDDHVEFIAYIRHENVQANGVAFYAAGNNVNPQSTTAHLRMTLNAFIALPSGLVDSTPDPDADLTFIEVTRSAPVLVEGSGARILYQGTFGKYDPQPGPAPETFAGAGDLATFRFPHVPGHFRAIDVDAATVNYDVGDETATLIPDGIIAGCGSHFSNACRTVFTNTDTGLLPAIKFFETANASDADLQTALEGGGVNLTDAETEALMGRVLEGWPDGGGGHKPQLGGVDRSTPAVIGISPLAAGGNTRPTIAYFGALDGMLHAVCVEALAGTGCAEEGQELWAYVPRTQLPRLRLNTQRVDGSPNVTDLFGDFDGDGTREWRTVLVFQTGTGETSIPAVAPAAIALDITDPFDPIVLWDREMGGLGMTLSTGPVRIGGITTPVTFAAVNRGNNPTSGFTLAAIQGDTSAVLWAADLAYGDRGAGNPSVPTSAIPSGASGVDIDQQGFITHVTVTTLFGDLWLLDADDGQNVYGADPLFRFETDFHPIGVPPVQYRAADTNRLHAIVASGGYADPFETSWAPDTTEQFVVGVWLESPVALINEDASEDFGDGRSFIVNLGAGKRVFAQPVISGDNVFIVTDSEDVNLDTYGFGGASGELVAYSLSGLAAGTAVATTTPLQSGAGGVDVSSTGEAIGGGPGASASVVAPPADYNASGISTEPGLLTSPSGRLIWLKLQ